MEIGKVVDNIQAIKTEMKISSMKQNVQNAKGLWKSSGNSLWKNKRSPRTSRRFA
jgi:hypothetical protein